MKLRKTTMYLRQWYYDPADSTWKPVRTYSTDRDEESFYFATTTTKAKVESGKPYDGYYEFGKLPVRVFVNGKEYLAGYTVAIRGNLSFKPGKYEMTATHDTSVDDADFDLWNSKGLSNVNSGSPYEYRYGLDTFPLVRALANNSDGKIHTLDSMVVLAGSNTADANGNRPNSADQTQYRLDATGDGKDVSFDLTFGKSESHINGGYIMPPAAPIQGVIWDDANYNGVREDNERGIGGVKLNIYQWYLDTDDKTDENPDGTWKRTYTVNEKGETSLVAPTPATTSYGVPIKDPEGNVIQDLPLGYYKTDEVPTSFQKPGATDDTEYLCGYTVEVAGIPLGYTLTRAHATEVPQNAANDDVNAVVNSDSDIFRTSPKTDTFGADGSHSFATDGTADTFMLVNRANEKADSGSYRVRTDGMVVIARERNASSSAEGKTLKRYNGVTYDTDMNVNPYQHGGDGGLVAVPHTTIQGVMWDDSYQNTWAAGGLTPDPIRDLAELNRSYDGIFQPDYESGLAGRTVGLTQWAFDGANWNRVTTFDGDVAGFVDETTTDEEGNVTTTGNKLENITYNNDGMRTVTTGSTGFSQKDGKVVTNLNRGTYVFSNLPSAIVGVGADPSALKVAADTSISLYGDTYSLASYQVEIDGLGRGGSDSDGTDSWMLTRYHEGADITVDSDVETTDRVGVAAFAANRNGRVVTDRSSVVTTDGATVDGTRTAAGNAGGNIAGGRIVLASEGVAEGEGRTHLALTSDYASVPAGQLIADAAGTVAYDWLTVDTTKVLVKTEWNDAGQLVETYDFYNNTVAGGNVGAVHPTRQSIRGILWNDENNNGIQDVEVDEDGKRTAEEPMNGYEVTLTRYWFDAASKQWVRDTKFTPQTTTTGRVLTRKGLDKDYELAVGESLEANGTSFDLYREGTYSFENLDASTMRDDGTWVVYGYKVDVTDQRVTTDELFRSKYQVAGATYTENSDLTEGKSLTADDEYIVLLETVAADKTTPNGLTSQDSNIVYAPASNNDDQTRHFYTGEDGETYEKELLKSDGLVAYDLMMGASRDHNDGGLIVPPAYAIDGFVWEDADYDGLYNYHTERRVTTEKDGTQTEADYIEYGYNEKQVVLKQYLLGADGEWVRNTNFGNDTSVRAENGVNAPTQVLDPKGLVAADGTTPADRLTFTIPQSTYLGNGMVAVKTADMDEYLGSAAIVAEGSLGGEAVSGFYQFDNLPTAYRTWDAAAGKYTYTLASYTVEVNGNKADEGMSSLLVTSFEAESTIHDAVNSRVQPMVTDEDKGAGTNTDGLAHVWSLYETNNYPVFLDEENIQTGSDAHTNGEACSIDECTTTEGEISKNTALWRIVLAGIADADSVAGQFGALETEDVDEDGAVTYRYDFAAGQDQNAMNAGFVPPDRSSLVGQAWYDEDYDGKNDADTSDDRIDTDDRDKDEQGVEGLRVILTQYYFVPTYDSKGNQLLEDEDNNVFYLDTDAATDEFPRGQLRLVENNGSNVVSGADGKVYLVRSGRTYDYDALYKNGVRELKDSGYWVENTNFEGGRQYKDASDEPVVPDVPEVPVDPDQPTDPDTPETPNPDIPEQGGDESGDNAGETTDGEAGAETAGVRVISAPAISSYALARAAMAAASAEPFADGEVTEVETPGTDPACTHDNKEYTAAATDGFHDWSCKDCDATGVNEPCFDTDRDGKCDGCTSCLHLGATTGTDKGDGTHDVACDECGKVMGNLAHADANGDGNCDGCGAFTCTHKNVTWKDNFNNTHTAICDACKQQTVTAEHVDEMTNTGNRPEPDGKCDLCGGMIIEDHQLWTLTDEEGIYDFDNLPGYVLVDSDIKRPAAPGEDIKKVYQPYGVVNAKGTALSTSDLVALHKRPVTAGMISQLTAAEIKSLSAEQMNAIMAEGADDLKAAYEARQAALEAADPTFTAATPYLTGYAIKVVDDSGEYVASRFHVEGAGTGNNSDLTSFDSSLTDNVNDENEKANEIYAVVAEKIEDDADLNGGILASAYAVRYLKTYYDLANRMYYKRAFDAGLTKQLPVLIDGNIWNDVDSDGIMAEDEERIEGAVVRLVRYWYDETGIGYWEAKPGDTPAGDGSLEGSGLTAEEHAEIVNLADPFKAKDGETWTEEQQKAAADAMIAFIENLRGEVRDLTGEARAQAATKNLAKLNVLYHQHTDFLVSYAEETEPAEGETPAKTELVIYSAWAEVQRDLTDWVGAETPPEEKGVWRRDYTFTQDSVHSLAGNVDLSKDGLGSSYPYYPLDDDDVLDLGVPDTTYLDQNQMEYIPGAAFDVTDENGHWHFLAHGTGIHQASSDSAAFKVLFGYRAEIVSYPDEDVWAPTLQHIDDKVDDTVNSDFDDDTQALRPNIADEAGHKGDYTLPSDLVEAGQKAGDLLILTTLADGSESSTTSGAYATYDSQVNRDPEDVDCDHVDEDTATTVADGLCDKCGLCLHEKDELGFCTVEGCEHANNADFDCCTTAGTGEPTDPDAPEVPGETEEPEVPGDAETFTTRIMMAGDAAAREAVANPNYSDTYIEEMIAWINNATQEELENMDQSRHDAIFGKHRVDEVTKQPLYLETIGTDADGKPIEQETTSPTNADGEPNLPCYDDSGDQRLYEAYQARMASLVGDNQWSDLNWFSSLSHGFGLFRIAQAKITGIVWQDDNYDGVQDASETGRIANVPVSLKRYWFGTDATGTGWHLDETFNATTVSGADGRWTFDNLDVAGKRVIGGKETTVLYGFQVTVDDLPKGYGVTHLNRGTASTDSDLNEDTKFIEADDPQGGMIVLAMPSDKREYVGNGAAYLLGPNGTVWVISLGVDSEFNDTGLVPYALAVIAGVAFDDPEADGLKDETAIAVPGMTVYLERKVLDAAAIGFNGASYTPTALAAVEGMTVKSDDGWTEVASQETDANGAYRFDGLPMVDGNDKPYLYRVRSTMPDGKEWVAINAGNDDNNDSDWGEATGTVIGTGSRVGITPAMSVLASFTATRTTPNAYGQMFNLLGAYNWTEEDGRSVDLGMTGEDDDWRTLVFTTPWGTNLFYVKLPQTGDELMVWMFALAAMAAAAMALAAFARRREEEDEEEGATA